MKNVQKRFEDYMKKDNKSHMLGKLGEILCHDTLEMFCMGHDLDINHPNIFDEYVLSFTREAFKNFSAGWNDHHQAIEENLYYQAQE